MKKIIVLLVFIFGVILVPNNCIAQLKTYKFEQIDSLQSIQKRKIVVFIHTDWCKFCQAMKQTTFKNKKVISALNYNFYFIDFNAEQIGLVRFNNTNFNFKSTGNKVGVHELAIALGTVNNQLSYPILCFLNEKNEIIYQNNTFLSADSLLQIFKTIN